MLQVFCPGDHTNIYVIINNAGKATGYSAYKLLIIITNTLLLIKETKVPINTFKYYKKQVFCTVCSNRAQLYS